MSSKKYTITFMIAVMMTALCGCTDELDYLTDKTRPSEVVCFTTSLPQQAPRKVVRNSYDMLSIEEEQWDLITSKSDAVTRGMPMSLLEGSAGVLAYLYDKWSSSTLPWSEMYNKEFVFDGDEMTAATQDIKWSKIAKETNNDTLAFYVYAPYQIEGCTLSSSDTGGVPTLTYQVNDEISKQKDIIVATWKGSEGVNYGQSVVSRSVPLAFEHILTGVKFKVGFACTAKSLTVRGVHNSGVYSMGDKWSVNTAQKHDYTINFGTNGQSFDAGEELTGNESTLMMIPQTLADGAEVEFTYIADGKTYTETALLKGQWNEGKMVTYTLHNSTPPTYIYFDLAAGNISIAEGENKVTGYVYEKGKETAVKKTYTHKDGNSYYIYQSTAAKRTAAKPTGVVSNGVVILPEYDRVTHNGMSWGDFITNNTDVESVISAWDNKEGAGEAYASSIGTANINKPGAAGAVRNVGREATKSRIHITGNLGNVNLHIDNLYSSYQQRNPGSDGVVRTRTQAGISFIPSWTTGNTVLTINIIGDNRFGCINYQNTNKDINRLVFEGTGTLTVADSDYYRDSGGLGSNRSCSVIGGKDEPKAEQDVYNITFNSGIIYAGATTSACTAIGGGGNGHTTIEINGATITAVAKSTGTAIGGGSGLVQPGGEGHITINDGNIYAYNYKNSSNVPSSAIGGAGSQDVDGSLGNVTINGGYVFAYSQHGTAIGGGSSKKTKGGDANITISGGQVIAKSGDGAGIGGGSACTGGSNSSSTKYNGGTATVNIWGNPIIRTGSIGGGTTKDPQGGKIGSAVINISGGDIQAQFVMASGAKTTPSFTMTGGTIRNSSVDDEEYIHIKKKGGAVYLEDGKFTMSDGIIKDCSAEQGGAVYIERKSTTPMGDDEFNFLMTGGEIKSCSATGGTTEAGHGGAVYLNGGQVKMTGGLMNYNYSENGNGGAIYISNGNFLMEEGLPRITKNSAQKGDGGAVFVTSHINDANQTVKVNLQRGQIVENTANNYGGGVCVDMEGNATKADVVIGKDGQGVTEKDADPLITKNISLLQGGGLYVRGKNASITINSGMLDKNIVSAHVKNENVAISKDGGIVTLNDGLVTHQVVTFKSNYANGPEDVTQKIVTNTNSHLMPKPEEFVRGGYNFVCWNTRPDGMGTDYADQQLMVISEDITLYAKWKAQ